jgi:hypothetical protein
MASARSEGLAASGVEARLAGLVPVLESYPIGQRVRFPAHTSWETTNDGSIVTFVHLAAAGETRGNGRSEIRQTEVVRRGQPTLTASKESSSTLLVLPVKGLNIPFADVALHDGDSVVVEQRQPQHVSVLGLVRNAGTFPIPPDTQYNLAQALGFAGGLDLKADPRYVSVYRLRGDGRIASATFQVIDPRNQEQLTESMAIRLKPGDVVYVEHTPRTRSNLFFERIFRVNLGLYFSPDELWQ